LVGTLVGLYCPPALPLARDFVAEAKACLRVELRTWDREGAIEDAVKRRDRGRAGAMRCNVCYNAEYLFYPFWPRRAPLWRVLAFHTESGRDAMWPMLSTS